MPSHLTPIASMMSVHRESRPIWTSGRDSGENEALAVDRNACAFFCEGGELARDRQSRHVCRSVRNYRKPEGRGISCRNRDLDQNSDLLSSRAGLGLGAVG